MSLLSGFPPEAVHWLGGVAGVMTSFAYAPQVYRSWVTKSVGDVSVTMYAVMSTGILLWLVYGVLIDSWPLIASNAVAELLTCSVLILHLVYGRSKTRD